MNCATAENLLDLHREGRLRPGRAAAVAAHLKDCARCAALAEPLGRPGPAAPAALKARLAAALRAGAAEAPPPEPSRRLGGTAAVLLLAAAGALLSAALQLGLPGTISQRLLSPVSVEALR